MVAGRFKLHHESLMKIPGERYSKLLPIASIYGGNASGKSTFVQAVSCLRRIVLQGDTTSVEPHMLAKDGKTQPTTFTCCFVVGEDVLEYQICIRAGRVTFEELVAIVKGRRERVYRREPGCAFSVGKMAAAQCPKDDLAYAQKMGDSLPDTEVFLTTARRLQVAALSNYVFLCHRWFGETLCIIGADSQRIGLGVELLTQLGTYSTALADADTGVEKLQFHEVNANVEDLVPPHFLSWFKKSDAVVSEIPGDRSSLIVKEENGLKVIKCHSVYTTPDGTQSAMPLANESDGTRRYLHLLPILLDRRKNRVYLVDELDRSLHTLLTRSLIRRFRSVVESGEIKLQLIFTTHDVALLDDGNFRKDEIWVTERDETHCSHLVSLAEFKDIRQELLIRKLYLEGRIGGIPNIDDTYGL